MQGLYVHIPFCKSRCIYCDFYSTTHGAEMQQGFARALEGEIECRSGYLRSGNLDTIYIGGGTPSVLAPGILAEIFDIIARHFDIMPGAEVTIEANPDDVSAEFAQFLASLPVNRVSMGVQTFDDGMLRFLNRRHTAGQAEEAIRNLTDAGISDISIDLIYGLPGQTSGQWHSDMEHAFSLPINHLSAYSLMFEEGTRLYKLLESGQVDEADEELSLRMYKDLMTRAKEAGFVHYEISNFARPGHTARHNGGYWDGMHYLGLGPGAHSYNGDSRHANLPDLKKYIDARGMVLSSELSEQEALSLQIKKEEAMLTSLRTARGLDLRQFGSQFGSQAADRLLMRAKPHLEAGRLITLPHRPESFCDPALQSDNAEDNATPQALALTTRGIFLSNTIISDLFE